jgi:hypothetical protein
MSFQPYWLAMTDFRGRHFGFLAILCSGWAVARIAIIGIQLGTQNDMTMDQRQNAPADISSVQGFAVAASLPDDLTIHCCWVTPGALPMPYRKQRPNLLSSPSSKLAFLPSTSPELPSSPAIWIANEAIDRSSTMLPSNKKRRELRGEYYAYSFWRVGGGGNGLTSGGQYGGSQSGFIATFDLNHYNRAGSPQRLALLLRGAVAHSNLDERELAAGIRWRPSRSLPFSITGERRFRNKRTDSFSVYAAGGVSEVQLPLKFHLDSFGQAGVVSGKDGGPFFDFIARADRKFIELPKAAVHAGLGLLAGGQKDAVRVDVGPSLRSDITIDKTKFRLTADWRFRIAGDAKPGNGPAITLSTSF